MVRRIDPGEAGPNVTPRGSRSRFVVGVSARPPTPAHGYRAAMPPTLHRCTFTGVLWEHDGPGGWCFVSLPEDDADDIDELTSGRTNGFGSVRVEVTVGATTWRTSLFPDTKRATYVLPVKRPVRIAEGLQVGAPMAIDLQVLDEAAPGRRGSTAGGAGR